MHVFLWHPDIISEWECGEKKNWKQHPTFQREKESNNNKKQRKKEGKKETNK